MVIGADICCGSEISRVNAVVVYVQGNITFCYVRKSSFSFVVSETQSDYFGVDRRFFKMMGRRLLPGHLYGTIPGSATKTYFVASSRQTR